MTSEQDRAPEFELPGVVDHRFEQFALRDATRAGNAVLLLSYPFDFSPVCTTEVCAIRDAEWFELTPNLSVWALSGDSSYAHQAFATEHNLQFPLLSDTSGQVAEAYGVLYDELEGHERVPKRAVILIDSEQTIQYKWVAEDALTKPDFGPVKEAVDVLADNHDDVVPAELEIDVSYGGM